jgi:hypothetical protein
MAFKALWCPFFRSIIQIHDGIGSTFHRVSFRSFKIVYTGEQAFRDIETA